MHIYLSASTLTQNLNLRTKREYTQNLSLRTKRE